MGKSRAEIQKAYRERKKAKEGSAYLKKETARVMQYYEPSNVIGRHKLRSRRERNKNYMRKKRAELKQDHNENPISRGQENNLRAVNDLDNAITQHEPNHEGPCDSTTEPCNSPQLDVSIDSPSSVADASSSSCKKPLIVNLKFKRNRGSWKKSKALKSATDKLKLLQQKVQSLKKRNETLKKRLQRSHSATPPSKSMTKNTNINPVNRKRKHPESNYMSPKSKSKIELRHEGISPSKHPKLVKTLTFHNCIVQEVGDKIKPDRGRSRQRSSLQIVCGKLLKRYRLGSICSRELDVNRSQILKSEKQKNIAKRRQAVERAKLKTSVLQFLERDDNSACLPGKRDATKSKSGVNQTRILNDYLYNLNLKYKSENPRVNVSLTTFASFRPAYIKLVKYSSRRTCLCQRHQNMALKVKGLKSAGATNTESPDVLIRQSTDNEIIQRIADCEAETISFSEWKRKDVNHKGKMTKRMMIESVKLSKPEFMNMFRKDLKEFREHIRRVNCQYEQIKQLKDKLPQNHAICQMDFAENYSCGHAEEIQTAYFDKCSVTLHPVVVYLRNQNGTMEHASFIYVSDTQAHNSGTVFAFLKHINKELKSRCPNIDFIHYVTDSPTSQYRNKSMMYVVANHQQIFGISASWQYWEAGHGKGPCDGVGGASKRQADLAVKRHIAVIQSSWDYFCWGKSQTGSQTKYCFVSKDECDDAQRQLSEYSVKPVKGTMDIHSVVQTSSGEIAVRNTSCFCDDCFQNGQFILSCNGWIRHNLKYQPISESEFDTNLEQNGMRTEIIHEIATENEHADLSDEAVVASVNDYVAAVYNDRWYIGKITAYDPDDEDLSYKITFMESGKSKLCPTFKWPLFKEDHIWISKKEILCVIKEPVPHGTRKMFKLQAHDLEKITTQFENYKLN